MIYARFLTRLLFIACSSALIGNCARSEPSCGSPLYATDFDGVPEYGSKQSLIETINQGRTIRIRWAYDFDDDNVADLVHWAEADFLTIFEGEVFGQVRAIHAQTPEIGRANIALREPFAQWSGILSTNGTLQGRLSNDRGAFRTRTVQIQWCRENVD